MENGSAIGPFGISDINLVVSCRAIVRCGCGITVSVFDFEMESLNSNCKELAVRWYSKFLVEIGFFLSSHFDYRLNHEKLARYIAVDYLMRFR